MLHIRVVTPPELSTLVIEVVDATPAAHNIVIIRGAARRPSGDLVQFDIAREAANVVIGQLRQTGVHRSGSIAVERIDVALSDVAQGSERVAPGESTEAVIWEEVESKMRDDGTLTASYVAMMTVAIMIGAVGILTDSPVLIVGAMVVGPDYGPLAAVTFHLHRSRYLKSYKALRTLTIGYLAGLFGATTLTVGVRLFGNVPAAYTRGLRPLTSFVSRPDGWSVIVALLAGIAGMLALTEAKAGTIVGVLISVTTIPAASNLGVALASERWGEFGGAAGQLALNLVLLVAVGLVVLRVEHFVGQRRSHAGAIS